MQITLDPRLKQVVSGLTHPKAFSEWVVEGAKRIIFDNAVPSQAFRPGLLLIGANPDTSWEEELRLVYRDCLTREQQDWFRGCLVTELEIVDPHRDPEKSEQYVIYLLSMARAVRAREVTPDILLGLINQRFRQSKHVFDSVLLTWCNLPTGVEFSGAPVALSASERLIDYVLMDHRYAPGKWMLHLFIGIARKRPTSLLEHVFRFCDDTSLALFSALSDRRKQTTLFELENLSERGLVAWARLCQTELVRRLRSHVYFGEHQSSRRSLAEVFDFEAERARRSGGQSISMGVPSRLARVRHERRGEGQ